jgi:ABC-type transport system involved in Fe-S cluster assembly fused permease/ATPase subunit
MTTEDFLVAICFVIWTVIVIDWIQKMKTNIKEVNEYIHKQTNEVARLRELLNRAIELAKEAIRMADYDYENDKFGKVTLMKKELFELRQQIK